MKDWAIYPATRDDSDDIREIWNPLIRTSIASFESQEKIRDEIAQKIDSVFQGGFGFWLARETQGQKTLLGFVYYNRFRANSGYAFTLEHSIYVRPPAKGKGIGRALLSHAENDATAKNYASFIAAISGENTTAIAFHKALGYNQIARLPKVGYKFERWFDLVLMQKFLRKI